MRPLENGFESGNQSLRNQFGYRPVREVNLELVVNESDARASLDLIIGNQFDSFSEHVAGQPQNGLSPLLFQLRTAG